MDPSNLPPNSNNIEDYRLYTNSAEEASMKARNAAKAYLGATMSMSTAKSDISAQQREAYHISSKVRGKRDQQ